MPYYAVRIGRNPGIYKTWDECKTEVHKFPKARYKKFDTEAEATEFINSSDKPGWGNEKSASGGGSDSKPATAPSGSKKDLAIADCNIEVPMDQLAIAKKEKSLIEKEKKLEELKGKDNSGSTIVYTAGSCIDNNAPEGSDDASAGIGVYWGPGDPRNISERLPGRQTNQRAEINAAIRAIEQAKTFGVRDLTIRTDCQNMIDSMDKWISRWKKNGWRTANNEPVINKEDFQELDLVSDRSIQITYVKVRRHTGIEGNDVAHELAKRGATQPAR